MTNFAENRFFYQTDHYTALSLCHQSMPYHEMISYCHLRMKRSMVLFTAHGTIGKFRRGNAHIKNLSQICHASGHWLYHSLSRGLLYEAYGIWNIDDYVESLSRSVVRKQVSSAREVIIFPRYCGRCLFFPALDTRLWHNTSHLKWYGKHPNNFCETGPRL